jgi:murein DD-endopeptidase MepM/ murein hydrolase activator NlpD
MIKPFKKGVIGFDYGQKTDYNTRHLGVDWDTNFEDLPCPVRSKVINVITGTEGGLTIWFQPIGQSRVIRWLHLNKCYVKAGQIVEEGQIIVQSGNSGHRPGTGAPYEPHTHEDHWKSKVTLNFADTLNPHDFYKGVIMAGQLKTANIHGEEGIFIPAATTEEFKLLCAKFGKDPNNIDINV